MSEPDSSGSRASSNGLNELSNELSLSKAYYMGSKLEKEWEGG
jgi:hypothetical protein